MENENKKKNLEKLLSELLDWYKAVNFSSLKKTLLEVLPETKQQIVYQLSTPDRASDKISNIMKRAGFTASSRTIRDWQNSWVKIGILRQVSERKRERIFDLKNFGIGLDIDTLKLERKE